jgi:hypothetical protein
MESAQILMIVQISSLISNDLSYVQTDYPVFVVFIEDLKVKYISSVFSSLSEVHKFYRFTEFSELILTTDVSSFEDYTRLFFLNSGDACRHSAQSPDAVGQGGTIHDCRNTSDCLCLKCFEALSSLGGNK